jgi:biopolymer transport protein ExbD
MRQSILNRRRRRKIKKDFELPLTSMMDMLIILVVFLLKSFATNATAFSPSSNIKLPVSTAEEMPADAVNVVVEPTGLIVDNEKVLEFVQEPGAPAPTSDNAKYALPPHLISDSGRRILPLFDSLVRSREKAELFMSKAIWKDKAGQVTKPKFHGVLVIQADKGVRYELLRKIMYTAGAAEFKTFKLVTVKKDG